MNYNEFLCLESAKNDIVDREKGEKNEELGRFSALGSINL
jgi:hypothetical protein